MDAQILIVAMTNGHDPRYLDAAENALMHTLTLDRLAANGTRFGKCIQVLSDLRAGSRLRYWATCSQDRVLGQCAGL